MTRERLAGWSRGAGQAARRPTSGRWPANLGVAVDGIAVAPLVLRAAQRRAWGRSCRRSAARALGFSERFAAMGASPAVIVRADDLGAS
jgi:hypothetical protein